MKIKNLNFIERHIEKIVLAVGVVFLLVVVWFFVLGNPYKVEVTGRGGTQQASAQEIEQMIRQHASDLERQINREELPFDRIPLPSWTTDFRHRLTGRFLPVDILATPMAHPGLDRSLIAGVAVVNPQRIVPEPPPPSEVIAKADYAVLAHATDQNQERQLVRLIGEIPTPRDFRYVSVGGTFDMEAWRNRLKDPRVAVDQRIPEDWWRYRLYITKVTLQRQELDLATGQWGEAVDVAAIPGPRPSFQNDEARYTAAEVTPLLENIREWQERLARPAFVDLERGIWTPPGSEQQLTETQAQELVEVLDRLAQLRRRQAAATPAATPRPPAPVRRPATRPGAGDEPRLDGPDQPAPTIQPQPQSDAGSGLEAQIAELEARRDELLGIARPQPLPEEQPMVEPGFPGQEPGVNRRTRPGTRPGPASQNNNRRPSAVPALPPTKLWAHDLTVKPGHTYRYRFIVSVVSPLFHINDVPREQYTAYYNRLSLSSQPSAWTEPVRVDPELHYFMTGQDIGRRQVTVDVFRIFNGIWVKQTFDVRAGDPVGGVVSLPYDGQSLSVDMNTGDMVVDVIFPASTLGGSSAAAQTRMLVFDLQDQQMKDRTLGSDAQDSTHQRLIREMHIRNALAGNALTQGPAH